MVNNLNYSTFIQKANKYLYRKVVNHTHNQGFLF